MKSCAILKKYESDPPALTTYKRCDVTNCSNYVLAGNQCCAACTEEIAALEEWSRRQAEKEAARKKQPTTLNSFFYLLWALVMVWAVVIAFWPYIYATLRLWKNFFTN